jgi:hypothetical protein
MHRPTTATWIPCSWRVTASASDPLPGRPYRYLAALRGRLFFFNSRILRRTDSPRLWHPRLSTPTLSGETATLTTNRHAPDERHPPRLRRDPLRELPITETHPDRLAVIGRLFGLACPEPSRARVLELGCAAGGNLLPIAWHLPETPLCRAGIVPHPGPARCGPGQCAGTAQCRDQASGSHGLLAGGGAVRLHHRPRSLLLGATGSAGPCPAHLRVKARARRRSLHQLQHPARRAPAKHAARHAAAPCAQPHGPRERLAAAREMIEFLATPLEAEPPGPRLAARRVEAPSGRARQLPLSRVPGGDERPPAVQRLRGAGR